MSEHEPASVKVQIERARSDPTNGWWVADVLAAFDYLVSDFGYQLSEVSLHFRGSTVRYRGPVFDLVIAYDPEDTGRLSAELWVRDDLVRGAEHPRAFAVNDVIRARDPEAVIPEARLPNLGRAAVSRALATWAQGLHMLAPDVLTGSWPDGVPTTCL